VAVSVFKTACDPSYVGLGGFDSHALPPFDSRLDFRIQRRIVTFRRFQLLLAPFAGAALIGLASAANAQTDSAPPRVTRMNPADTVRPPITPKRAFLISLVAPGSAQNILGRHRVAAALLGIETMSIAMIRESGADVREARGQLGDTLVMSYVDANGDLLATPALERRRFESTEVQSRRSHVEDWVALLIANHLFAACDAFVAASLWDVPAHVALGGTRNRLFIVGQIPW
jgi:hypothetical protein